jgi:hypothetical protein
MVSLPGPLHGAKANETHVETHVAAEGEGKRRSVVREYGSQVRSQPGMWIVLHSYSSLATRVATMFTRR